MDPRMAVELVQRYNADPRSFTDQEAELIAQIAQAIGMPFPRENKPIRKGLFDLADTMSLGLVPNEWRPESRGESAFGETGIDKFAGGVGTVAGVGGAIGGALLGGPAALAAGGAGLRGAAGLAGAGIRAGARAAPGMSQAAGSFARGARGIMTGGATAAGSAGARAGAYGQNLAQMLRNLRQQMAGGFRQGYGGYGPGMQMPARSFTSRSATPLLTAGV